jgi:hypothetical protein
MSIVDPTAPKTTAAPRQSAPAGPPKPVARPVGGAGAVVQAPQLKRKASGPVESSQVKVQRKDGASQPAQGNGAGRPTATPSAPRPNPPTSITTVPYRGTAAPGSARIASPVIKKPVPQTTTSIAPPKAAVPATKPALPAATSASASSAAPKKGYHAMLEKAKKIEATKPPAPPVKNGPTKMLTKKEREALKAEASAGAKGKKPGVGLSVRPTGGKGAALPEKKKSVEVGYQGTARPAKQPIQVGYKGTARPASAPASSSRGGTPAAKAKPKPTKARYDGYAEWSDLDDMEDEEDYASDGSSDMEGGVWDVEQEEQLALKAAKKEDAEALAEEMRLKREKEERIRRLKGLSNKAAAKRKY